VKVKIGDAYYDSADFPIMVVLEEFDKQNLLQMFQEADSNKYMAFRGAHFKTAEEAREWMDDKRKFMRG